MKSNLIQHFSQVFDPKFDESRVLQKDTHGFLFVIDQNYALMGWIFRFRNLRTMELLEYNVFRNI